MDPEFVRFWAGDSGRDLLVSPTLEVSPTPRIPPRMPPRMLAEHRWAAFWAETRPEAAAQNSRNSGRDRSGRRSGRRGLSGRPSLCAIHGLCTTVSDVFLLHGVLGRKTQAHSVRKLALRRKLGCASCYDSSVINLHVRIINFSIFQKSARFLV